MKSDLSAYQSYQVFLNYPFEAEFERLSHAMHFAVIASGLVPVYARDLTAPDKPRLETLVDAITHCHYSAHDFSKDHGDGSNELARFNMPVEMGMALFHALQTQRVGHRCAFFVTSPHLYNQFASDLAGLDPISYNGDTSLLIGVYEWLRGVVSPILFNQQPTHEVNVQFELVKMKLGELMGSGPEGVPSHAEAQEVMYQVAEKCGWWDWRDTKAGKLEFPRCRSPGESANETTSAEREANPYSADPNEQPAYAIVRLIDCKDGNGSDDSVSDGEPRCRAGPALKGIRPVRSWRRRIQMAISRASRASSVCDWRPVRRRFVVHICRLMPAEL